MPGYRTHVLGGLAAFGVTYFFVQSPMHTDPILVAQLAAWCLLGSLFPDIDTKSMGRLVWFRILGGMALFGLIAQQGAIVGLSGTLWLLALIANHRGLFHRFWFILLLALLGLMVTDIIAPQYLGYMNNALLFFVIGALSHLLLDFGLRKTFKI
ncbi:MAG: metal-dependent hydrolase [Candidatus Babeliales bacterium]